MLYNVPIQIKNMYNILNQYFENIINVSDAELYRLLSTELRCFLTQIIDENMKNPRMSMSDLYDELYGVPQGSFHSSISTIERLNDSVFVDNLFRNSIPPTPKDQPTEIQKLINTAAQTVAEMIANEPENS